MSDLDLDAIRERADLTHAMPLLRLIVNAKDHDGRIQHGCVVVDGHELDRLVRRVWFNDIPALLAEVARLRARPECTALCGDVERDRDRLAARLTEAEAVIVAAQLELSTDSPVWWTLDGYDGSMDAVRDLVAARDAAEKLADKAQAERDEARAEVERQRFAMSVSETMAGVYEQIQDALASILGPNPDDGAGGGTVADVWLIGQQRDEARAEIGRLTERLTARDRLFDLQRSAIAAAQLPDGVTVTEYTVSLLPLDHIDAHLFSIQVEWRGLGRWAAIRMRNCLANDGSGWDFEAQPSSREDDWLDRYRFDTAEAAIAAAVAAAPHITCNRLTAAQILAADGGEQA